MSGLIAAFGGWDPGSGAFRRANARVSALGGDEEQTWVGDGSVLTVSRKGWQLDRDFCGPVLVLDEGDLVVAADASLYGASRLVRSLEESDFGPGEHTPSHLIAAGYRRWGPDLVHRLNGDYAFVLWDRERQMVFAARDPMGSRPLFWAQSGQRLAIASSARALAELTGRTGSLNVAALASQAAGLLWSAGIDTAFDGVEVFPAAHRASWSAGPFGTRRFWSPPVRPEGPAADPAEAAEELRRLLEEAVADRLAAGTTTVWMSGGWDSTAVFAAGRNRLGAGEAHRLRPVSISYPEGDPGREDPLIEMVARRWDAEVAWIPSDEIPLLDGLEDRAGRADEPPSHLYELWNRALARRTRDCGARVSLDGNGGDQLFASSDVVLADHLRRGAIRPLARHLRAKRDHGWRYLARFSLLPLVPPRALRGVERVLGTRVPWHYLERPAAPWVRPDAISRLKLRERDLDAIRARGSSLAQAENVALVTMPLVGWNFGYIRGALLDEGVETRSPLLDLRVIEFALRRPPAERARDRETKILLRRSMTGLLPERFLAPRPYRTGTTVGFSTRRMREAYPELVRRLFDQPLRLAELGIVDAGKLREAASGWEGNDWVRVNLFNTMKVEFWLRGLEATPSREVVSGAASRQTVAV